MIEPAINPDRTRAALVPAMGRFIKGLLILDVGRFGPMPMDDWTPEDHALARMWAVNEARGDRKTPPQKVVEHIRALRKHCGVDGFMWDIDLLAGDLVT